MSDSRELACFSTWSAGRKGYAERVREIFRDYLTSKDLVHTLQRAVILDHLLKAERHLTQEEIYAALRPQGVGKVTVSRTLKLLKECRLVEAVTDSKGMGRFEIRMERPRHDHFVCVDCRRIIEIQWPESERMQAKVAKRLGLTISYHRHELFGRCRGCSKKRGRGG